MSNRPKTVWDLCEQVCEAIELAPRNYYQGTWYTNADNVYEDACGTAYCRAGWMYSIGKNGRDSSSLIYKYASRVLQMSGVDQEDIDALFRGSACHPYKPGSPKYIQAGIEGMQTFMKKYESALKAAKLDDNGEVISEKAGTA